MTESIEYNDTSRPKGRAVAFEESASGNFDFANAQSQNASGRPDDLTRSQLLFWFRADQGQAIPPCYLLDVVVTLSGGDFLSNQGLGSKLIEEFGSIRGVLAADAGRLIRLLEMEGQEDWFIEQLTMRVKATSALMKLALFEEVQGRLIISSRQSLLDYLKIAMGSEAIEQFRVLFLDKQNALIKDEIQSQGTVDHTPLYPREVAKRCLELGASAIIMVHNHPTGNPTPSRADIEMTKRVEETLNPLRIALHDHLIVTMDRHLSFKLHGLI